MALKVCAQWCGSLGYCPWSSTHSQTVLDDLLNKALSFSRILKKKKILLWKVKPKKKRLFYHPSLIRICLSKPATPHALHQAMDVSK